jgi:hypothetical protein
MADWVGHAAWDLRPLHERLLNRLKELLRLFADVTTAPVLDPGRGRTLTWRSTSLDHVLCDARLRDLKPELEQFAVDTRRAPKRVLEAHPSDQRTEI